jgi:hypothetical protein
MRFRFSVQFAACVVAVTLIFGCGGTGSDHSATDKPAAEKTAAEATQTDAATAAHTVWIWAKPTCIHPGPRYARFPGMMSTRQRL